MEQREVYDSLEPMLEMAQKRLVRRFFYNSLSSELGNRYSVGPGVDRTFKFDYFQNTCVLCLYAMSPDSDFEFLTTGFPGLASTSEILWHDVQKTPHGVRIGPRMKFSPKVSFALPSKPKNEYEPIMRLLRLPPRAIPSCISSKFSIAELQR